MKGKILYIGKAKNLRQRVCQYFRPGGDGRAMIPFLLEQIADIQTIIVRSEKEALLVENNLIKQYRPKYNVFLKDDKSYIALRVTTQHKWPKVELIRYRGTPKGKALYFGPYTSAYSARETLDLIRKVFPLRQCSDQEFARRTRPCILYDMKRCIAPCVGKCTDEEYDILVGKTIRFLKGNDKEILKDLYQQMEEEAEELRFEKAAQILKTIRHLEATIEKQHVDKPMGIDSDVFGIYREAGELLLAQLIFRGGKLLGIHHYQFSNIAQDDEEVLTTFILQHYQGKSELPREILLPTKIDGSEPLGNLLSESAGRTVSLIAPQRGDRLAHIDMAKQNAESAFKQARDKEALRERTLVEMQEKLHLTNYPQTIECFDNSNLGGTEPVASAVSYLNGEKNTKNYRRYMIKTAKGGDDYGAMYEVLTRRIRRGKEENDLPDLIILDGGKGHLNVGLRVLKENNVITTEMISIAKEQSRHDKGVTQEMVFLPEVKDPILLNKYSSVLFFLQQIRDEAHRFAITYQKKRRSKKIRASALDAIPGIGPKKKQILLKHFGSLKKVKEASLDELASIKGISTKDADLIFECLQKIP
ncbi:MAG: excinuclease ABC subunit UvrC [Chlamydiales bacterium]